LVVLGILLSGEMAVRLLVKETVKGPMLAGRPLRPYVWKQVARRLMEREKSLPEWEQVLVFDSQLGWTVAPNSISANGLFQSGVHGIRVGPTRSDQLNGSNARRRVALLGDSYVFGETEFERTWGRQLEQSLGDGRQVLNFGVPGYGLGQIYLRYQKDVRPFHPDVVIVGFSDLVEFRTVGVYGFLCFGQGKPSWAMPRFVIGQGQLKLINVPLIPLDALARLRSIEDLPCVRYAWDYRPTEWDTTFSRRHLARSYLLRTYMAISRPTAPARPEISFEEVRSLNVALLSRLLSDIRGDNAVPLLLYLPNEDDYDPRMRPSPTRQLLRENGFTYLDLTSCLGEVAADRRFLPSGGHYSSEGETAVARYLGPIVHDCLNI
jgi:hypothetical protein